MTGLLKRGSRQGRSPVGALLCALGLVGLCAGPLGCGPSSRSSTTAPPAADASDRAGDEITRLLGELTQLVRKYSAEQRQPPANLDDLVAKGYLNEAPAAPAGKRFVITRSLQVELANR